MGQKNWHVVWGSWAPNQLRSGHWSISTASFKASPPLASVVPTVVILVTYHSNGGPQQFKGTSIAISTLGLFGHFSELLPFFPSLAATRNSF